MKNIVFPLVLLTLLTVLLAPILANAQEKIPNCCQLSRTITLEGVDYEKDQYVGGEGTCNLVAGDGALTGKYKTKEWGLLCLLSSVYAITDWIFTFLMVVVGVFVILGAFGLVTSAGDPEKIKKGKNYILYAAIGMIVGLLAKAVPSLIGSLLG